MSRTEPPLPAVSADDVCAAVDGDHRALEAVTRAWKSDASVRADWHAYQLIGDALRSSDCAGSAERDAALLARVRARLAAEPAVLAPVAHAEAASAPTTPKRWVPAAMAASIAAVLGWTVLQLGAGGSRAPAEVSAAAPGAAIQTAAVPAAVVPAPSMTNTPATAASSVMIRSAELDRYLAAHQQFATTSVVPAPGLVVRSVSTTASPLR
jgi:sigma-E factor negative regulatory protein RseA